MRRLIRDVDNLDRYLVSNDALSEQLRLTCAAPALNTASTAIVEAAVRIWGNRLFTWKSGRLLVGTLAARGPIAGAEMFVLMSSGDPRADAPLLAATTEAFSEVFERHPDVFLATTRTLLRAYTKPAAESPTRPPEL